MTKEQAQELLELIVDGAATLDEETILIETKMDRTKRDELAAALREIAQ